jgi:hypothetical protein
MEQHDLEEPDDDFYGQDANADTDVPPDLPASSPAPSPVCEPEPAPAPAVTVAPQSDLSSPALRSLPIDVQAAVLRTASEHGIAHDDPAWILLEAAQVSVDAVEQMQKVSSTVATAIARLPSDVAAAGQRLSTEASASVEMSMQEAGKKTAVAIATSMDCMATSIKTAMNTGADSINARVAEIGSALDGAVKQRRDEIIAEWSKAALKSAQDAVKKSGTMRLAVSYFSIIGTLMFAGLFGAGLMYFAEDFTGRMMPAGAYAQVLPDKAGTILMLPRSSVQASAYCKGTDNICIAVPYKKQSIKDLFK